MDVQIEDRDSGVWYYNDCLGKLTLAQAKVDALEQEVSELGNQCRDKIARCQVLEGEIKKLKIKIETRENEIEELRKELKQVLAKEKQDHMNSILSLVKVLEIVITGD